MTYNRSEIADLLVRFSRLLTVDQHAVGLKPAQWAALRYLTRANRFSRTPGALTDYLGATKGTVSQTLMALERKGLLVKRRAVNDKRLVHLDLLSAGWEVVKRDPLSQFEAIIGTLGGQDKQHLADGLNKLLSAKLDVDGRLPFGKCASCRYFEEHHPLGEPHRCGLFEEKLSAPDSKLICVEYESSA